MASFLFCLLSTHNENKREDVNKIQRETIILTIPIYRRVRPCVPQRSRQLPVVMLVHCCSTRGTSALQNGFCIIRRGHTSETRRPHVCICQHRETPHTYQERRAGHYVAGGRERSSKRRGRGLWEARNAARPTDKAHAAD